MKLSQNFLVDPTVVQELIASSRPSNHVIEIGPGTGAITKELLKQGCHVTAVEIDPHLAAGLPKHENLAVHCADALTFDYPKTGTLISNLPFHVATPLILRLITLPLDVITVIVQDEVAKRLGAQPSTKPYGALTLNVQLFAKTQYLFPIPPEAFSPKPKITSAAIQLTPHPKSHDIDIDFIYDAFRQTRKMLKNVIPNIEPAMRACHLDPKTRAESLSLDAFTALYQEYRNHQP